LSADKKQYSLPASQRLKKPAQFQSVYQSKQWGGSRFFTFNVLAKDKNCDSKHNNAVLGVTVSKKVSKRAVDRNKIKRQIREQDSLLELWTKVLKWQKWHQRQLDKTSKN